MANPDRGSRLYRLSKGRFGRAPRTGLTPEQRATRNDLRAVLNAYDLSTPEEQRRVTEELRQGGNPVISGDAARRGRAAATISDVTGESRERGLRDLQTLEEASEQIPGIAALLRLMAKEDNQGK